MLRNIVIVYVYAFPDRVEQPDPWSIYPTRGVVNSTQTYRRLNLWVEGVVPLAELVEDELPFPQSVRSLREEKIGLSDPVN